MCKLRISRQLYRAVFLAFYASAVAAGGVPDYDANSWKTLIADDCRVFFDGCNQCVREPGKAAACTRKACAEYRQPRCRDAEATTGAVNRPRAAETVNYTCAGGARFSVMYHEYRQDDQRVVLGEAEIMLRDEQTHTLYRLQRERSASGEKYGDSTGLMFFARGQQALVMRQDERLYTECAANGQAGLPSVNDTAE